MLKILVFSDFTLHSRVLYFRHFGEKYRFPPRESSIPRIVNMFNSSLILWPCIVHPTSDLSKLALSFRVGVFQCHQHSDRPFKENELKSMHYKLLFTLLKLKFYNLFVDIHINTRINSHLIFPLLYKIQKMLF
jgi:hypothetical protein